MTCLICGEQGDRLCSNGCLEVANREYQDNAVRLYQLKADGDADERYRLSQRNGEIAAALIDWRPEPSESGQA